MRYLLLAAAMVAVILCGGCGDGSTAEKAPVTQGRANVKIQWPQSGRLIPAATTSMKIGLFKGNAAVPFLEQIVDRPVGAEETTVAFDTLPLGELTIVAWAYPEAGGRGTFLARGCVIVTVLPDQVVTTTLTLSSTVTYLTLNPISATIATEQTLQLEATARNADGDVVLVAPSALQWSARNVPGTTAAGQVALVNDIGRVTGKLAGFAEISVRDVESGVVASTPACITVVESGPSTVTINPLAVTLNPGGIQVFTASVTGTPNTGVNWYVQEGTAGGQIDPGGVYIAPRVAGTYHVIAESKADRNCFTVATVTVRPTVKITPGATTLSIGEAMHFAAEVGFTSNQAVTWSVLEGDAGGMINRNGDYLAPSIPGTYHIVATSVADPAVSATATVSVKSGNIDGTIE